MSDYEEPISVRVSRLNSQLAMEDPYHDLPQLNRETLLDAITSLYQECEEGRVAVSETIKRGFIEKFGNMMLELEENRIKINDFNLNAVIGRGHFGTVYVATEVRTGDIYAIKTLRKSDIINKNMSYDERDIMARTKSPWLTSLQYAFYDRTHLYLVMDFCSGGNFRGFMNRHFSKIAEPRAVFYLSEMIQAINSLHLMGYIHRDIHPENILLDSSGHLKLTDFGSVTQIGKNNPLPNLYYFTPNVVGYMAPELIKSCKNLQTHYGKSCDYWSLGIIAYELAYGCIPFINYTMEGTIHKIIYYQEFLKFAKRDVSNIYKHFVKSLLTTDNKRLDYSKIIIHPLFKDIAFDSLREYAAPFVPAPNSPEDTSNFQPIKNVYPIALRFNNIQTELYGQNLSFIGYTYINVNTISPGVRAYLDQNEEESSTTRTELERMKKQLKDINMKGFKVLRTRYVDSIRNLKKVKNDKKKIEKQLIALRAKCVIQTKALRTAQTVKKKVQIRAHRKAAENLSRDETFEKELYQRLIDKIEKQGRDVTELRTVCDGIVVSPQASKTITEGVQNHIQQMETNVQTQIEGLKEFISTTINGKICSKEQLEEHIRKEQAFEETLKISANQNLSLKRSCLESNNECKKLKRELTLAQKERTANKTLKEHLTKSQREIEKLLKEKQNTNSLECALKYERNNTKVLQQKIADLDYILNSMKLQKLSSDEEEEKLKTHITKLFKEKESVKTQLQNVLDELEFTKKKEKRLQDILSKQKSGISTAESRASDIIYECQIKKLEENIKELKKVAACDKQELWKATKKNLMQEKELVNCKTEKQTIQYYLNDGNLKMCALQNENKHLLKIIEDGQQKVSKSNDIESLNNNLKTEVVHLKNDLSKCHEKINWYIKKFNKEDEDKILLVTANNTVERLNKKLKSETKLRDDVEKELAKVKQEREMISNKENETEKELQDCKNKLKSSELKIKNMEELLQSKSEDEKEKGNQNEEATANVETLKTYCAGYKNQLAWLKDEIKISSDKCADTEKIYKETKRMYDKCLTRKEELSKQLRQSQEEKNKFSQENFELKSDNTSLMSQLKKIKSKINEKSEFYKQREEKRDSVVKQQRKLIEDLQGMLPMNKKRPLSDTILGSSKKTKSSATSPIDFHETQSTECDGNILPQKDINILSISDETLEQPQEPTEGNSAQIVHQADSHRFNTSISLMSSKKCLVCSGYLPKDSSGSACEKCLISPDPECFKNIIRPCGLPGESSEQLAQSLNTSDKSEEQIELQSWVKIPNDEGWVKKYARLEKEILRIYDNEPTEILPPIQTLEICLGSVYVMLTKDSTTIDCPNTNGTDLPLIITLSGDEKTQHVMFLNTSDKEKWITVLEKILQNKVTTLGYVIAMLENNLKVNCLYVISPHTLLLGCENGLYVANNNEEIQITGLNEVHQIDVIETIDNCLMICENTRVLVKVEWKFLQSVAELAPFIYPHVDVTKISDQEGFHTFTINPTNDVLCAATSKQIFIFKYDFDTTEFLTVSIIETIEPCSCLLFKESSLVVGTNKYYETDLESFETKEFLDVSDPSLFRVQKCYETGSYPFAIVCNDDDPKEFLLCFNECGCFVDKFGRRTRKSDLEWSTTPFSVAYFAPFLFLMYSSEIEIVRLLRESIDSFRAVFQGYRYLGYNKQGVFICHEDKIIHLNPKQMVTELKINK